MEFKTWLLFMITDFLVCVTPGPAVILVSTQGLKYGPKYSCFGALGITTGSLVYFILSAFGLAALILAAGRLFEYITYAGALYLIVIGAGMIYNSYKKTTQIIVTEVKKEKYGKLFIQGFLTEVSNPKAIVFFVALLPLFIKPAGNIHLQFTILGVTSITMETLILIGYGFIANRSKKLVKESSVFTKIQDRIAGFALVGIGVNLFFMKRILK